MQDEHQASSDPASKRTITPRQRAVMERIDRRVPIKVIAQDLGVSETRINQHIRALKDYFEAESLNELVETYRASDQAPANEEEPLSDPAYTKNQMPRPGPDGDRGSRVDTAGTSATHTVSDNGEAVLAASGEPQVVPGVLDGEYAVLARLVVIVAIAFGIVAAVLLVVAAGMALSEVMDGMAYVPVEETPATD